jgi:dipeptidyl aminopeptidase/acylaminoacyl peptidase
LRRRLAILGLAALGAGPGCIGVGFDLADLPSEPLVVVYRTRDESERRVELLQQSRQSAVRRERGSTYEASYVKLEAAADALGLGRTAAEKAADLLGRMSFVDVPREAVEPLEFAFRGDRPVDWSPDRQRLLFASLRSEAVQLYEWDRASGEVRPVTMGPAEHSGGSYGPDGRLALAEQVRSADGKRKISRIVVTAPGGGSPRPLTEGPEDTKPEWSPDGRWVVYESRDPAGNPVVASVRADGSAPPRVLAPGRDPTFAPDNQLVVYSARTRAGWRLAEMHADGQGKRPIGGGPRDEHDPRVSPDGAYVVYVYDDEGRQQLRVRTRDGRKDRPLIWNGDGIAPVW